MGVNVDKTRRDDKPGGIDNRAAEPVRLPIAVIRPRFIPMSPLKAGILVPSTIVPFLISNS